MNTLNKLSIAGALASLSMASFQANAFDLNTLVNSAVQAATQEVAKAIVSSDDKPSLIDQASSMFSNSGTSAGVSNTKPANWPSAYTWYAYDKTAAQPAYNGRVQEVRLPKNLGRGIRFNTLPLQHAIVRVRGNGKNKIAILADPTCPYSKQLEKNLNKLTNVTIYTLVAPTLGPSGKGLTEQVMCQPSNQARAQAWENLMLNNQKPPAAPNCTTPSDKIIKSFDRLTTDDGSYYNKTSPSTFLSNNVALPGLSDQEEIEVIMTYKP